jgi:hypothetical protein
MTKEKLTTYAFAAVLCWMLYKLITFFIYRRLTRKLKGADLETFTRHFGEDYAFRFLSGDIRRYKWQKGLFVIKASFDKQDRLTYSEVSPFDFFGLFTKIVFL